MLEQSRREIDSLIRKDPANVGFEDTRACVTTSRAMAFAVLSEEPSATMTERFQHIAQPESTLEEAEAFSRRAKSRESQALAGMARNSITPIKARLAGSSAERPSP